MHVLSRFPPLFKGGLRGVETHGATRVPGDLPADIIYTIRRL